MKPPSLKQQIRDDVAEAVRAIFRKYQDRLGRRHEGPHAPALWITDAASRAYWQAYREGRPS